MKRNLKNILITGGCGFIGSNLIHYLGRIKNSGIKRLINLDALTYAGDLKYLTNFNSDFFYKFVNGNILDSKLVEELFREFEIDTVIHLAAESHVDNSILKPKIFLETNIIGTVELLNVAKLVWETTEGKLFHHVSTDEVYGSLGESGYFLETTPYDPSSPYSASKASSDHFVKAYNRTYNLPVTISNCSNNYGPFQNKEKLIPTIILSLIQKKSIPVYGDGKNIRDWLFVEDHCSAIWKIVNLGKLGETYNVGGNNEWKNIEIVHKLCEIYSELKKENLKDLLNLINFVKDRPGHDKRYAIDSSKIQKELNWFPLETFETGLRKTVEYYLN